MAVPETPLERNISLSASLFPRMLLSNSKTHTIVPCAILVDLERVPIAFGFDRSPFVLVFPRNSDNRPNMSCSRNFEDILDPDNAGKILRYEGTVSTGFSAQHPLEKCGFTSSPKYTEGDKQPLSKMDERISGETDRATDRRSWWSEVLAVDRDAKE